MGATGKIPEVQKGGSTKGKEEREVRGYFRKLKEDMLERGRTKAGVFGSATYNKETSTGN
jgi:hypothetical protein